MLSIGRFLHKLVQRIALHNLGFPIVFVEWRLFAVSHQSSKGGGIRHPFLQLEYVARALPIG